MQNSLLIYCLLNFSFISFPVLFFVVLRNEKHYFYIVLIPYHQNLVTTPANQITAINRFNMCHPFNESCTHSHADNWHGVFALSVDCSIHKRMETKKNGKY